MPLDLYYCPGSPPCLSVMLTAKALGLKLNLKYVDVMKGDNKTPEYHKINPQHTVPTLDDNGFCLPESRAIMTYLCEQYGKNDSLYPKDLKKRAIVDQRLYFDIGTFYRRFADYYYPVIFENCDYFPVKLDKIKDALKVLNCFLENSDFVAGNTLTIADLSTVASLSTVDVLNLDMTPYKNVSKWYSKVKASAPGWEEAIKKSVLDFKTVIDDYTKNKGPAHSRPMSK